LAQKELDQEKILRQKLQKESQGEYDRSVQEEKKKQIQLIQEHEERVSQLKKAHAKQCDELCQEVLKANLEADRLHSQLEGANINPRKPRLFPKKEESTGASAMVILSVAFAVSSVSYSFRDRKTQCCLFISQTLRSFQIVVFFGFKVDLFTKEALCSPVMPGSILRSTPLAMSFQSPWWAPSKYKEQAFKAVCSSEAPVLLEWEPDGKENKLTVTRGGKKTLIRRTVSKTEVYGDRLRLWTKKGVAEDHGSVWSN